MKKIYDTIFLLGVHVHILLDRVLVAIETRFGDKNGKQ
jgi:hypothetical protein